MELLAAAMQELVAHFHSDLLDRLQAVGGEARAEHAYKACEQIKAQGGKVTREAGPMKHGTTVIAFVEDPDGYKIEFIQRKTH